MLSAALRSPAMDGPPARAGRGPRDGQKNEEAYVGRSPYNSEKRRKELDRLKKQEEKRQRRFNKKSERENTEVPPEGAANPDETPATDAGSKET